MNAWLIYSPGEAEEGAGYWSNEFGWVDAEQATEFTDHEKQHLRLPMTANNDARWVDANA